MAFSAVSAQLTMAEYRIQGCLGKRINGTVSARVSRNIIQEYR